MGNNSEANRYEELDALRGIAALMVVLFHLTLATEINTVGFKFGTTGVDLFFMISGFVIFMSLNRVNSSKEFILNRVSRLYPTYWVCVTLTFLMLGLYAFYKHTEIPVIEYLANMTMFQFYLGQPDLDGPYWTMIIEMIFYITILLLFHFKKIRYTNQIFLTLSILTLIGVTFLHNTLANELVERIPLLQFLPLFLAGITFYNMYNQKNKLLINYGILCICFVCQVLMFNDVGRSRAFINQMEYACMLGGYFLLFILFAHGKLKCIVSKTTLFLGKISYPLYLIHQCITTRFVIPLCINRLHMNVWVVTCCICLPLVIVLATLITYHIDVPWSFKMKQKLRSMLSVQ